MRRQTGSRLGAIVSLSLMLSLGAATSGSAVALTERQAPAKAATKASSTSAATVSSATKATGVRVRPTRAAQADAPTVDLPRPVHGVTAIRLLDEQVDEVAALNDTTSDELLALLRADASVWLDTDGAAFYKDVTASAPRTDPVAAEAALDETFLLHSQPGAQKTIFLDFDGGSASATQWHQQYPAVPATQPGWDPAGNGPTFDSAELTAIQTVWAAVAEDYAAFDVDVTTADPGAAAINRSSTSDPTYGSHVLITPSVDAANAICSSQCGGVAYLSVFGDMLGAGGDGYGHYQPAWVFPQLLGNSPKNISEAAAHEVGHNLGLSHDGVAGGAGYDSGHNGWAPIMGAGYSQPITQWSKGDYAAADNPQDDLAIVRGMLGPRGDEAGSSVAGAVTVPTGKAYVTSRTDVDTYLLGTCAGAVNVSANAAASHADLDVKLTLLDATGVPVATADPTSTPTSPSVAAGMSASIARTLAPGTYFAAVDGVGNGPWSTGYDDYASLGAYTMDVSGCDGAAPTGTPTQPTGTAATPDPNTPTVTVSWAPPSSAGSSAVTGYLLTRSGDDAAVQVDASTTNYTWTGLASSTTYAFTVTALNAQGPGASATIDATTAAGNLPPGVPQHVSGGWYSLGQLGLLSYSAPADSGSYPVTGYQIYADGSYLGTLSSTSVTISGLQPGPHTLGVAALSQAGSGPVASVPVTVPARPANDAFTQSYVLPGVEGVTVGTNLESSAEPGEPRPPAAEFGAGGASLWYSWTAPASGPVSFSTHSMVAGRDTTLAAYTGSALRSLTLVAGNDDQNSFLRLSRIQFTATAGKTYSIAVDGFRGFAEGVGQFSLTWAGTAVAPQATTSTLAVDVAGRSATLTASVSASVGDPVGNVEFRDGDVLVGYGEVSSANPAPSLTLTDLVRGDHSFRATFVPEDNTAFTGSQSPIVIASAAATLTTTTLQSTTDAQTVSLAAAVAVSAGTASGIVQFYEDSTLVGSATVADDSASLALTGVDPGVHSYTATFVPSDPERYAGSTSSSRSVTVDAPPGQAQTSTVLAGQVDGRSMTLTATVRADSGSPAGTVQFRDGATVIGTATLERGTAVLTVDDLTRGTHHLRARHVPAESAAFGSSESTDLVVEIAATPTTTSLTTAVSERSVTLQASVTPTSNGAIEFRDGSVLVGTVALAAGTGQLTIVDVPAGEHHYSASFVPADDLRQATSTSVTRTVTVRASPTSTALDSSVDAHRVTLVATVTAAAGNPSGSIEFREGGTILAIEPVSAGTASTSLTNVATGGHSYIATFVPTVPTSYAGSASSAHTVTVDATPTTTALTTAVDGRKVTLTAVSTTGSGTLTGAVQFREDDALLATKPLTVGPQVLELTGVSPGAHRYTATFVPSGTSHSGSTSPTRSVTVRVASRTALAATVEGRAVTLRAEVTTDGGSPVGSVEIRDDGTLVGTAPLGSGVASLRLVDVTPGEHSYEATFAASDPAAYAGSTSARSAVQVADAQAAQATSTRLSVGVVRRTVTLNAGVTSGGGVPNGAVRFTQDGIPLDVVPLLGGTAALTQAGVAAGSHSYTATFVPTDPTAYDASASAPQDASVDRTTTSTALTGSLRGSTVTLETTVTGTDGIVPQGLVRILDGATLVETLQLDSGRATLVLPAVSAGSHTYRANFEASADLAGSASPGLDLVVPAPPVASKTTIAAPRTARAGTRPVVKVRVLRGLAAATGKVVLTCGTKKVTLGLTSGQVSYRLPKVRRGKLRLSVEYLGNSTTTASSAGATVTVR